jgi:hypothetical protein
MCVLHYAHNTKWGREKKEIEELHFIYIRQHKAILKNVHSLHKSAKRVNRERRERHGSNIYNKDFMVTQSKESA